MSKGSTVETDPTFKEVWDNMSKIDCSGQVEKKNGLSYLSWAWAWGITMEHYPYAQYEMLPNEVLADDTVIVWCKVTIGHLERSMWLAVMDFKNKPIARPSSTHVANSRMRCLTKCLSMFGLGHYIYAGEDLPVDAKPEPVQDKAVDDGENSFGSEEEAVKAAEFFMQTVESMHSDSIESLAEAWSANKKLIDTFDRHYPEVYQMVKTFFTNLKLKLKGE